MSPSPVERIRVWHSQGDTKPKKASELSSPGAKGLCVCITGEGMGVGLGLKAQQAPRSFFHCRMWAELCLCPQSEGLWPAETGLVQLQAGGQKIFLGSQQAMHEAGTLPALL